MRPGKSPSIAPMKTKYLNKTILQSRQRGVAVLFVCFWVLWFALIVVHSQVTQKHLTAVQLGEGAEGARVTVVSDGSLNDYEAYRSGNRFYVKIPLADLNFVPPRLRADGFDDIQIQRAGDGVLISFKLQPGATARVEPLGNHLQVVFSAPNRIARNSATQSNAVNSNATSVGNASRNTDVAGPVPPSNANASRERFATPVERETISGNVGPRRRHSQQRNSSRQQHLIATTATNDRLPQTSTAVASPSATPYVAPTPQNSSYPPLSDIGAKPSIGSNINTGANQWRARASAALAWMKANRLATFVAALILLSLIVYFLASLRRRRTDVVKTKQATTSKVQPKLSTEELSERPQQEDVRPAPVVNATENRQPVTPTAPAASGIEKSAFSRPSFAGPTLARESSEEQEREVFEL